MKTTKTSNSTTPKNRNGGNPGPKNKNTTAPSIKAKLMKSIGQPLIASTSLSKVACLERSAGMVVSRLVDICVISY